jgi:hypothetical protein
MEKAPRPGFLPGKAAHGISIMLLETDILV